MGKKLFLLLSFISFISSFGARIKDIATFEGFKPTYLIGYGLVVGLKGTGDSATVKFTIQSIANMLKRFGVIVDPQTLTLRNVAAVMVTATVPPYARTGMRFDVTVSAIGDAKSLAGGVLLMTPLKGPDGRIYAVAQGPVIVKQRGKGLNAVAYPNVGVVINGGMMERDLPFYMVRNSVNIVLNNPDITTAYRVAKAINNTFKEKLAIPINSSTIHVRIPFGKNPVDFLAKIEQIEVNPDNVATVVIDSRSGVVVFGANVRIKPVSVSVEGYTITVKKYAPVVYPYPTGEGSTVPPPKSGALIEQRKKVITEIEGTTVGDLVNALNEIGLPPKKIISVLEAMKNAGALEAQIKVQ